MMKIYDIKKEDFIKIAEGEMVSLERLIKSYRLCQKMWLEIKYERQRQNRNN